MDAPRKQLAAVIEDGPAIQQSTIDAMVESWTPLFKAAFLAENGMGRAPYQRFANNPQGFCTEILGSKLTDGQVEVLESVRDHRVTIVQSANSVGKTFVGGDMAHWFFHSLPSSKVITCAAPPLDNLQRLLWGEIGRRALDRPEIMQGVRDRSLHYSRGPDWWLDGIAIPTSGTADVRQAKFSGKHAPYILFIIDEGDAVPPEVYKGIESCMTGGFARLVVFFNPRRQGGPVQKLIDEGANVVILDAFSHPNVQSGKEIIPGGTVDRAITVERINKWSRPALDDEVFDKSDPSWFEVPGYLDGVTLELSGGTTTPALAGNAWRKVKDEYPEMCHIVLARYPGQAVNQLIPRAWILRAQNLWLLRREMHGDAPPEGIRPAGGLDVADFGPDPSCLCKRYELWVAPFVKMNGMDGTKVGKWAAEHFHDAGGDACTVDTIGVGSGTPTAMQDWWDDYGLHGDCEQEHRAVPLRVSWAATDDRFHRMREELFWGVRDWLQRPGAMLPPGEAILNQAQAIHYWYDGKGLIRVTSKDNIKALIHQSPDEFESLALSIAEPDDEVLIGYG